MEALNLALQITARSGKLLFQSDLNFKELRVYVVKRQNHFTILLNDNDR